MQKKIASCKKIELLEAVPIPDTYGLILQTNNIFASSMRIAVNMSFEKPEVYPAFGHFIVTFIEKMLQEHKSHHFLIISSQDLATPVTPAVNASFCQIPGLSKNPFLKRWWYEVKLPGLLRKEKADLLICASGYCSLALKIPQVLLIHDLSYLHVPQFFSGRKLYFFRNAFPKHVRKASKLLVNAEITRRDLVKNFPGSLADILIIKPVPADGYRPISWQDKDLIKAAYSDGKEFFLFRGGLGERSNLLNLLKAFSLFKKRQQTNMQLLIAAEEQEGFDQLRDKLATYKYAPDVQLLHIPVQAELEKLTAAAYAIVIPNWFETFGGLVWEAVQCEVPMLIPEAGGLAESAGDAALYFDPASPESIATQMKIIFKDENLRTELIENGRRLEKPGWKQAGNIFSQTISGNSKTELSA